MVSRGKYLSHWANFVSIEEKLLSSVFLFPVVGNHNILGDEDATSYEALFHMGNTYLSEGNYWVDLRLIGLVVFNQYSISNERH